MKRLLVIIAAILYATLAYADGCVTQTFIVNGKTTICTTCCYFGNCTTSCY